MDSSRTPEPQKPTVLTLIELSAQLMVRAPLHDLSDMLGFLVDRHGANDSTLWGRSHHLDLDGARLCDLAVQLLQFRGILLREKRGPEAGGRENQCEMLLQIRTRKPRPHVKAFLGVC